MVSTDETERADAAVIRCELAGQVAAYAEDGISEGAVFEAAKEVVDVVSQTLSGEFVGVMEGEGSGCCVHRVYDARKDGRVLEGFPNVACAGKEAEVSGGGVAKVVNEEFAINVGGKVVFENEAGDGWRRTEERVGVGDDFVIGFGPDFEGISGADMSGHERDHFANAGFDQADVAEEVGGKECTEEGAHEGGGVAQVFAQDDVQRGGTEADAGSERRSEGGKGGSAYSSAAEIGVS